MKRSMIFLTTLILLASCAAPANQTVPAPDSIGSPQASLPEIIPQADIPPTMIEPASTDRSDTASDGWKIYRSAEFGYSFHYPADATIVLNDDPLHGITVVGPEKDGKSWPSFGVSHPSDRTEFRPPEKTDLFQWLTDHYLLDAERMPDVQIAGTTAVHLRKEPSPQSYAFDRYYFARTGQLYMVIILHTGEREDWDLYNHFLSSFRFEQASATIPAQTAIPTALAIDPGDYQGWWTYTHPVYNFSIMLPEDWIVEEDKINDPLMNGHQLILHPENESGSESIRLTFRRTGEAMLLWPTGVGQGEFVSQGTLEMAGGPVRRVLLVCPGGEVTSIWYHQAEDQPNITREGLEFGIIFRGASSHCEAGFSLSGKVQRVGEMVIASLKALEG